MIGSSKPQIFDVTHQDLTLSLAHQRGLLLNLTKSNLVLTQTVVWLVMEWDSQTASLCLSSDNCCKVLSAQLAVAVIMLGRICHCRFTFEDSKLIKD